MTREPFDPRSGNETSTGLRRLLTRPEIYELWSDLVGARRSRAELVRSYVRPEPGARLLDLGCGPGELLSYLPMDLTYAGVDISPEYIASAQRRFGHRGEFVVGDASRFAVDGRRFDIVVVFGVLHHLSDAQVRGILRAAALVLEPTGRLMTVDPTVTEGQSRIARAVIGRDRGQHVRTPPEYCRLASESFADVTTDVRHDLLRIPYSHCILEGSRPLPAS